MSTTTRRDLLKLTTTGAALARTGRAHAGPLGAGSSNAWEYREGESAEALETMTNLSPPRP